MAAGVRTRGSQVHTQAAGRCLSGILCRHTSVSPVQGQASHHRRLYHPQCRVHFPQPSASAPHRLAAAERPQSLRWLPTSAGRIRQEGTRTRPRWYAYVVYQVPVTQVRQGAQAGVLGLDRNVGQATDSDGTVRRMTDTTQLDSKRKRSTRRRRIAGSLTKLNRKRRRIQHNDTHHISRRLADTAHTVVIEDLHIQGMTQSAQGIADHPGRNVKAKSGLNHSILASSGGQMERKLAYKCSQTIKVNPQCLRQTCSRCGCRDKGNRPTQVRFHCVQCGFPHQCRSQCSDQHLGERRSPCGPRDGGICTARGVAVGHPNDPRTGYV